MHFCWTVHLKVKKLYPNSKETLERSSHWCQQRIILAVNLATGFTWYPANTSELPFPLIFHERNQNEIVNSQREMYWARFLHPEFPLLSNSGVYECTTFRMSLTLRRFDKMLIVNKPIIKLLFSTLTWRSLFLCNINATVLSQHWSLLENFQYFTTQNI